MASQFPLHRAVPRHRPVARPTSCPHGFSAWHVLAIGGVTDFYASGFLKEIRSVPVNDLIYDLRESTWRPFILPFYQNIFEERNGVPLARVNHLFVYKTVKEICETVQVPLFRYWDFEEHEIHRVVRAFNASLDIPLNRGSRKNRDLRET